MKDQVRDIIQPVFRRCKAGKSGFVVVIYYSTLPPSSMLEDIRQRITAEKLKISQLTFADLAPNPVAALAKYKQTDGIDIFSIVFNRETLMISNDRGLQLVDALNLQRNNFENQNLCAVFWVHADDFRILYEHSSNFMDYRIRTVELEAVPTETVGTRLDVIHNLPYPSIGPLFQGREAEMQQLNFQLRQSGFSAITQPSTIQGLGGIGKTRLAVEYAWRHLGNEYSTVLFVIADSPESLQANMANLARPELLDLPEHYVHDQTSSFKAVLKWLETNKEWLLILDNVDDESAVEAIQQIMEHLAGGAVIVTSRYRRWGSKVASQVLDNLTADQALKYLLDVTKGRRIETLQDYEAAKKLADRLGCLPLALEQATAFINHHSMTISDYLVSWDQHRQEALSWHDERLMNYPVSVAVTLQRTFDLLSPASRTLLRISAFLASEPIPQQMFEKDTDIVTEAMQLPSEELTQTYDAEFNTKDAIAELESYSMLNRHEKAFTIHRLVQEVIRSRIPEETRRIWIEKALHIVNDYAPAESYDVRTWTVLDALRPHAETIVKTADNAKITEPTSRLMSVLGNYLYAKALYSQSEYFLRRALEIEESSFGHDHPKVAIALNNLAQLLQDTNRLDKAEPLMRRSLKIFEDSLGRDHPNTQTVRNNLKYLK